MNINKLNNADIWNFDLLKRDNAGRWDLSDNSPDVVRDYIDQNCYRLPSRSYPLSFFKPLLTMKFVKYLVENDRDLAVKIGVINDTY